MKFYSILFITVITIFLSRCSSNKTVHTEPARKFITGNSNNKLEVLDWGGEGKTILFLAGLGNTAHVFRDFAPRFSDGFHVLGLTRRGFGKSEPSTAYDINALTGDILSVLDSLKLKKVILAGHSIAGEEITKFAGTYPDRVDKIIYIDAAYNRMGLDSMIKDPPSPPRPKFEDSASLENMQKYFASVNGFRMPDAEIKEAYIFSKEGRLIKDITADSIYGAIISGVTDPEYSKIKCSALAIYAVNSSAAGLLPFYSTLDSANAEKADRLFQIFNEVGKKERIRFKNEVKNGVVVEINEGDHYLFISHADETEKLMREFLDRR